MSTFLLLLIRSLQILRSSAYSVICLRSIAVPCGYVCTFKMNSRFFKLCRVYIFQFAENGKCRRISLELVSCEAHSNFERSRKRISSSLVYVLHKVTQDDSQRRFLAQQSVATLLRHCFECYNIVPT